MNELANSSIQEQVSFQELLNRAIQWDAEFSETERLPVGRVRVTETELILDRNSITLNDAARERLFASLGAPASYLTRRGPRIQTAILREHLENGDFGETPRVITQRGELYSILGKDLIELTHSELVTTVAEALGADADGLTVSRIDHTGSQIEAELVSATKAVEVRPGDVVKVGLHVRHSRYGGDATQIQSFALRLVCRNGMTQRECGSREGIVRTRRMPAIHPGAKALLVDQIRQLTVRAWNNLEPQLAELRSTATRPADVRMVLAKWLQDARISARTKGRKSDVPTIMDRILAAWRMEGAEDSLYAAVNALTWVGTHDQELSAHQRRVLSSLAGLLAYSHVHICERCFSVLAGGDHPRQHRDQQSALFA